MATAAAQAEEVPETPVYEDYFGFASAGKWYFPDNKQFIEFEVMNEGKKARFQKMTQRDLVLERQSGNARMKMDAAQERHELIRQSVTGWNVYRGGQPVKFDERNLADWLTLTNPRLVEDLEKAIRKANPWLLADMTVEDIDKEIENLKEMRAVAEERERGEGSSSNR